MCLQTTLYCQITIQCLLTNDNYDFICQNAAKSLIRVCQHIGPDPTAMLVLPKLQDLFNEFAFSQKKNTYSINLVGNTVGPKVKVSEEDFTESRMDLV